MVMIATITTAAIAATKDRNTNTKSRRCFLSSMVVVVAFNLLKKFLPSPKNKKNQPKLRRKKILIVNSFKLLRETGI